LKKVPGVQDVHWEESGTGVEYQVVGKMKTDIFASGVIPVDDAWVKINWWPQQDGEDAWYQFHYWDTTGFDCGWHRQPNRHTDSLGHYQERSSRDGEYEYEPYSLDEELPVAILWEIVDDQLVRTLKSRYG